MADDEVDEGERRARGRPRGQTREVTHDAGREGEFIGRNGEVLTRTQKGGIDPFHIPPEIIPTGWDYQWNAVTIYNNSDVLVGQNMKMYANGFRPVPADRHPGMYMPYGATGAIIREGQRLEERPTAMGDQARAEDIASAKRQMRDRDESLMGAKANLRGAMQNGFEMNPGRYRGTGGHLRMSIDPGVDAPVPNYDKLKP